MAIKNARITGANHLHAKRDGSGFVATPLVDVEPVGSTYLLDLWEHVPGYAVPFH